MPSIRAPTLPRWSVVGGADRRLFRGLQLAVERLREKSLQELPRLKVCFAPRWDADNLARFRIPGLGFGLRGLDFKNAEVPYLDPQFRIGAHHDLAHRREDHIGPPRGDIHILASRRRDLPDNVPLCVRLRPMSVVLHTFPFPTPSGGPPDRRL